MNHRDRNRPGRMAALFVMAASAFSGIFSEGLSAAPKCYEFAMRGFPASENFLVLTQEAPVIKRAEDQLKLPVEERNMHINGLIDTGNGGINGKWHWHIVPDEWDFAEISIEVCDGTPGYIEEHRDEWVKTVKRYCPWSSYVLRECVTVGSNRPPRGPARKLQSGAAGSLRTVRFSIFAGGKAELELRGLDGRLAAKLLDAHRNPGSYLLVWDPAGLDAGAYRLVLLERGRPAASEYLVLE